MKSTIDTTLRVGVEAISAGASLNPAAGGMAIYYDGLLRALARSDSVETLVAFVPPWDEGFGIPRAPKIRWVICRGLPRNRVGRVLYEQLALPLRAATQSPDVLLSTCNVRPLLLRGPSVVVLHHVQYLFYPDLYTRLRRAYLRTFIKESLRRADAIIAVSEWERDQILAQFDVDPSRVFTVYHGISNLVRRSPRFEGDQLTPPSRRPYVVFVSILYRHKNHSRLIEAFAEVVHDQGIPHDLVIAGGEANVTVSELKEAARRCGVAHRVQFLGAVHHEKVPNLVAGADVVAYPSLMETFGHPILEALALGRCVLTSNCGAMAEVAGGAARLVDPTDSADIAAGLADLITNHPLRERLAREGPQRAGEFTWDRCAEGTLRALRYAVARRSP
jgi:glycosyltransferase involved in cell wall biosynthesis